MTFKRDVAVVFYHAMHTQRIGPMCLSAVLREAGYRTEAVVGKAGRLVRRLAQIEGHALVCYSAMTGEYRGSLETAREVRARFGGRVTQAIGGVHATLYPETIPLDVFDAICVGEGERAVVPLLERARGCSAQRIDNIVDRVNPLETLRMTPLLSGDELPLPDPELYTQHTDAVLKEYYFIATSRRCPFRCTYCYNHVTAKVFKGLGPYFVQRPVEAVIDEMRLVKDRYGVGRFCIYADLTFLDRSWFDAFIRRYRDEIRLPFKCLAKADQIDDSVAARLAAAGCDLVEIGVETASETRRHDLLNKRITDRHIREAVENLHRHGIRSASTNMLGYPGETYAEALETIRFNRSMGVIQPWFLLFVPFPKTDLGERAIREGRVKPGLLERVIDHNPHDASLLDQEEIRRIEILHKFCYLLYRFPLLEGLVTALSRGPFFSFYRYVYRISYYFIYYRHTRHLSPGEHLSTIYHALVERL